MPEFQLDTNGAVEGVPPVKGHPSPPAVEVRYYGHIEWSYLDPFTQGYIEAMFFTGVEGPESDYKDGDFVEANATGFSDLAPEALASSIEDCRWFQGEPGKTTAWRRFQALADGVPAKVAWPDTTQAGRDFWYTRNGHGCGFWDGGWPEPYATALTDAAKAFGPVDVYLGDDGKVHIS